MNPWRWWRERRERAKIAARFSSYVDPALIDKIVAGVDFGDSAPHVMTVGCVATQGIATLSERLGAGVIPRLNESDARLEKLIREHSAWLHTMMMGTTVFSIGTLRPAEDGAARALRMARAVLALPPDPDGLKVRIALSTGPGCLRMDPPSGLLGLPVQRVPRLLEVARKHGISLVADEDTLTAAGEPLSEPVWTEDDETPSIPVYSVYQ